MNLSLQNGKKIVLCHFFTYCLFFYCIFFDFFVFAEDNDVSKNNTKKETAEFFINTEKNDNNQYLKPNDLLSFVQLALEKSEEKKIYNSNIRETKVAKALSALTFLPTVGYSKSDSIIPATAIMKYTTTPSASSIGAGAGSTATANPMFAATAQGSGSSYDINNYNLYVVQDLSFYKSLPNFKVQIIALKNQSLEASGAISDTAISFASIYCDLLYNSMALTLQDKIVNLTEKLLQIEKIKQSNDLQSDPMQIESQMLGAMTAREQIYGEKIRLATLYHSAIGENIRESEVPELTEPNYNEFSVLPFTDLDDFLSQVESGNQKIKTTANLLSQAIYAKTAAYMSILPDVKLSYGYTQQTLPFISFQAQTFTIDMNLQIFDGGRTYYNILRSHTNVKNASANKNITKNRTISAAKSMWFMFQSMQKNIASKEKILSYQLALFEKNIKLNQSGKTGNLTLLSAEINLLQAKISLLKARTEGIKLYYQIMAMAAMNPFTDL